MTMTNEEHFDAPKKVEHVAPAPTGTGKLPPEVDFKIANLRDGLDATPPGARISCGLHLGVSRIRIVRADNGEHIAHVRIEDAGPYTLTDETIAIASALYWSWWRSEDMRGITHAAEDASS